MVEGRTLPFGSSLLVCFYDCGRPPQAQDVWPGLSALRSWCFAFVNLSIIDARSVFFLFI